MAAKPSAETPGTLILGLDPGSLHTGFGLIEKRGSKLIALEHGRFSCPRKMPLVERLGSLSRSLRELLARTRPQMAVLESPFHGMNARTLIVLAQARGALLAALAERGIHVVEYSPAEVKSAVTGYGRADKAQVAKMVRLLLALGDARMSEDATDALATAICGAQRHRIDILQRLG